MLLEVCKVAKFFGTKCVFKDVHFRVAAQSLTLLMGANGAGKSTLMRIVAGLLQPSFGEVHVHVPVQSMGYLGHSTFVYPGLTALENLRFWGDMYGVCVAEKTLMHMLERVALAPYAQEKAGIFSRGMAQRLNLARVLLLQPKLWLLDEPATGMDTSARALLEHEVAQAKEAGAGIVWISHERHVAGADGLLLLQGGRISYEALDAKDMEAV